MTELFEFGADVVGEEVTTAHNDMRVSRADFVGDRSHLAAVAGQLVGRNFSLTGHLIGYTAVDVNDQPANRDVTNLPVVATDARVTERVSGVPEDELPCILIEGRAVDTTIRVTAHITSTGVAVRLLPQTHPESP